MQGMPPGAQPRALHEALGTWRGSLTLLVAGSALYGAAIGSWRGPQLALFTAVKLPLLMFTTCALTVPFQLLLARSLGVRWPGLQGIRLGLRCLATASVLLGSFAPIAFFFSRTGTSPSFEARTTHNLLYLLHTALIASSSLAGAWRLRTELGSGAPSRAIATGLWFGWVLIFAFVGGEVAWALRPFVGSVYEPVRFLRADALDGNAYEFIWSDVLPHLVDVALD